jgi:hypothetical protein
MEHVRVCDYDNDIYPRMVKKMRINENVPHRMIVSQINLQQAWEGLNAKCTLLLEAVWKQNTCDWTAWPVEDKETTLQNVNCLSSD